MNEMTLLPQIQTDFLEKKAKKEDWKDDYKFLVIYSNEFIR